MPRRTTWLPLLFASACALEVEDPEESIPLPPGSVPEFAGASAGESRPRERSRPPAPRPENMAEPAPAPAAGDDRVRPPRDVYPSSEPERSACEPDAGDSDAGECSAAWICISNDDCEDGLCVNGSCRAFCDEDDDCEAGRACVLGLCRSSPSGRFECLVAADCADHEDCVSASCLARCLSDDDCADSDDGPTCSLGYCGA